MGGGGHAGCVDLFQKVEIGENLAELACEALCFRFGQFKVCERCNVFYVSFGQSCGHGEIVVFCPGGSQQDLRIGQEMCAASR